LLDKTQLSVIQPLLIDSIMLAPLYETVPALEENLKLMIHTHFTQVYYAYTHFHVFQCKQKERSSMLKSNIIFWCWIFIPYFQL